MATQDNRYRGAGRFDRRITLLKPTEERDEFFEAQTVLTPVIENLAAEKIEGGINEGERVNKGDLTAMTVTDWEIRWYPHIQPNSTWKIRDEYGKLYEIIAPTTEISRRQFLRIRTKQVE